MPLTGAGAGALDRGSQHGTFRLRLGAGVSINTGSLERGRKHGTPRRSQLSTKGGLKLRAAAVGQQQATVPAAVACNTALAALLLRSSIA